MNARAKISYAAATVLLGTFPYRKETIMNGSVGQLYRSQSKRWHKVGNGCRITRPRV